MARGTLVRQGDAWTVQPSIWATTATFLKWLLILGATFMLFALPAAAQGPRPENLLLLLLGNFQFVIGLLVPLVPAVRLAFTKYTLDDDGIRVRSQILATQDHRIPWEKATMLLHRRTVMDRIFGLERLTIIAYGARGSTVHLMGLRDGAPVRAFAATAMRRHCSITALERGD